METIIYLLSGIIVGVILAYVYLTVFRRKTYQLQVERAERIIEDAKAKASQTLREAELEAKEVVHKAREAFEKENQQARKELQRWEQRLNQREEKLEKRYGKLEHEENRLRNQEKQLQKREKQLEIKEQQLQVLIEEEHKKLEKIAGLTAQEAKKELFRSLENEAKLEATQAIRRVEEEGKQQAERRARYILAQVMQQIASEVVSETTISVVDLPNDEMKGRIIGREGRNIRALEMATGVDIIIDDTPEMVTISCFDPLRRELARMTLEKLIQDGRIHPARIEEIVEKTQKELDKRILEVGEKVAYDMGFSDLHIDLIKLLGKLQFRTSYGQSVLEHSKEVALLAAKLAKEINANVDVAKRAGLLHDIGKAIDREVEGSHLELGRELLKKYGESEGVIHAMECHHGDVEPRTVEAMLVTIADAVSAARPGARRESLEAYVRRLEKLEAIAKDFQGVRKAYAIQAGRELRIIVESQKVKDEEAFWLSKDIARRIEQEMQYPGEIKVMVIRETRAVDYAR